MKKKNISRGIDSIFFPEKVPVQKKSKKESFRTTFRIDPDLMEQVKAIAYWERKTTTAVISKALQEYVNDKDVNLVKQAVENYREQS